MQHFTFKVCDAVLKFTTNSDILIREIRNDFESYEISKAHIIDGRITIIETKEKFPLMIPRYAIRETVVPPNSTIFSVPNRKFIEEKKKRILEIDFKRNEVKGYYKSPYKLSMFVRFLTKWMMIKTLEKKGTAFIHGSGVERDGYSLFFVGPSGFGKTHILLTLLTDGYRLITDDTILYRNGMVWPFYMRSKILEDMFKKFPILKKGLHEQNNKMKYLSEVGWLIDLGDIFSIQDQEVNPTKLFYIYVWNAVETKIEAISEKEMLSRLFHNYQIELGNSMWANQEREETLKKIFPLYYDFVKKSDCYKVFAGSNLSLFLKAIQET